MKLSSKSILSPSHSKEPPQMSLSSSFSRRLVTNGSIKGGGQASPMFPTVGRKRGLGSLENPEPSSPKVTCIGQVRVKTKKQGKKMRARSKRREGEASFRKTEENFQVAVNPDLSRQKSLKSQSFQYHNHQNLQQQECLPHRNQRWVHLPLTICEALRGFGADFSCFFPCRSSCTREKEVKAEEAGGGGDGSGGGQCREGSCGDALTRSRWLVTLQEGDDAKGREIELVMAEEEEEEEEDRTTENRPERRHRRHVFEDIDIEKLKNEEFVGEEVEEEKARVSICVPPKNALLLMRCRSDPVKMAALANRFLEPSIHKQDNEDEEEQVQMEEDKVDVFVDTEAVEAKPTNPESNEEEVKAEKADEDANAERENFSVATFFQEHGEEKVKNEEENDVIESFELSSSPALSAPSEPQNNEVSGKESTEKETTEEERPMEEEEENGSKEEENGSKERENGSKLERESGTLPDCLLLMMCEPKLSMEVSRETWVCTADFIRCLPARPAVKTGGGDRQTKKRVAVDSKPPLAPPPPQSIQPARSSCSFPAPVGLSEMSTTTVVGSNGYEPFVLTRCKSEPRRLPAQLGVGAAGVGF